MNKLQAKCNEWEKDVEVIFANALAGLINYKHKKNSQKRENFETILKTSKIFYYLFLILFSSSNFCLVNYYLFIYLRFKVYFSINWEKKLATKSVTILFM